MLLQRLRVVQEEELVGFQSRSGISIEVCLELVSLYFRATMREVEGIREKMVRDILSLESLEVTFNH